MDRIDRSVIDALGSKFDGRLVGTLGTRENVTALVRVRNPLQMCLLERNFDVVCSYPFIRSVGINCGLREAIRLERMQEVEYVSAQGRALAFEENMDHASYADMGDSDSAAVSGADTAKDTSDRFPTALRSPYAEILSKRGDLDGSGVTLCVMDTGISVHIDLSIPRERILHFVDFIGSVSEPYDDNGHGTFVAGVAAGNGTLSGGKVMGVAPRANLIGLKVIGKNGESGTFKILDGMQWLFDNFRQYGIRVVCMSFGADPLSYADPLKLGAEMLTRSGLIVVAASGNSGVNSLKSPAISSEVIAVGAVDANNKVAPFTSRGTYNGVARPDVYAEGVGVRGIAAGGTYSVMTGTSAAAPYVAGACCLLCQKYGNVTPVMARNAVISASRYVDGKRVFKL